MFIILKSRLNLSVLHIMLYQILIHSEQGTSIQSTTPPESKIQKGLVKAQVD